MRIRGIDTVRLMDSQAFVVLRRRLSHFAIHLCNGLCGLNQAPDGCLCRCHKDGRSWCNSCADSHCEAVAD